MTGTPGSEESGAGGCRKACVERTWSLEEQPSDSHLWEDAGEGLAVSPEVFRQEPDLVSNVELRRERDRSRGVVCKGVSEESARVGLEGSEEFSEIRQVGVDISEWEGDRRVGEKWTSPGAVLSVRPRLVDGFVGMEGRRKEGEGRLLRTCLGL